jgi:hypothetical protein
MMPFGFTPTGMSLIFDLVATSITETVFALWLVM